MSDVQNTPNAPAEANQAEQAITSLKKQADRLGIQYKSNTSIATLQKAIKDKLDAPIGGEDSPVVEDAVVGKSASVGKSVEDYTDEAMKLVRVIITPMESTKASNHEREMFCAGNSVVGTVKRVVEFGEPWHVEQIILNSIREKKYQMFQTKKNARGIEITTAKLVPAYGISILDPLTDQEIEELADRQIRTRSLEDE